MIDVCLLGCGGMMPLPDRFLTSLLLRCNGHCLLIDCGEATQLAIRNSGFGFKSIDTILLTHFHADHTAGIPGLLLTIGNSDRTEPLHIYGPVGCISIIRSICSICGELPFEVIIHELDDKKDNRFEVGKLEVKTIGLDHRIACLGYSIKLRRAGKFNPEKAKGLGIPVTMWKTLQSGFSVMVDDRIIYPDEVMGQSRRGLKVSYCTDTRPTKRLPDFVRDSDLFICEGMYGDDEKRQMAREKKHMLFSEAANIAKAGEVKQLWLTHYSPSLADPNEYMEFVRGIFENTIPGDNNMQTTLKFEE